MQSIKTALVTLKANMATYDREKDEAINISPLAEQKEQIQRVFDKLCAEWDLLNRSFTEKQKYPIRFIYILAHDLTTVQFRIQNWKRNITNKEIY